MSSYSYAETFSRTHARRLAGRVTTDLRQSHLLYGSPSESMLEKYRTELEELLIGGYVDRYQFGFKRDGKAVWSLRYVVGPDGSLTGTGTGGGVPAGVDITGATFFNFLTPSGSWSLAQRERARQPSSGDCRSSALTARCRASRAATGRATGRMRPAASRSTGPSSGGSQHD